MDMACMRVERGGILSQTHHGGTVGDDGLAFGKT